MQNLDRYRAFTLTELLIVITLIGILALVTLNLNISRLTQNQNIAIELSQIEIIFEEIRNNSFLGKGVGNPIQKADNWQIEISQNDGGKIQSFYTQSGTRENYAAGNWESRTGRNILSLQCQNFDESSIKDISGIGTLIFDGDNVTLNQCESFQKILYIEYGDTDFSDELRFNMLSGTLSRN